MTEQKRHFNTDFRPPPDQKAPWVAALRSGKYQQGIGRLCQNNTYCCLGVKAAIEGLFTQHASSYEKKTLYVLLKDGALACDRLDSDNIPSEVQNDLIKLNDGDPHPDIGEPIRCHSFNEISDIIEAEL